MTLEKEDVIAIAEALTQDPAFAERDAEYRAMRDRMYRRVPVRIPGLEDLGVQWRSPEIEHEASLYQRRILAATLKVSVAAQSESQRAAERASRVSRFLSRHYHYWRVRGVFDRALFDQASVGVGALHLSLDPQLLPVPGDDPDRDPLEAVRAWAKEQHQPFLALESVDPQTLYWDPAQEIFVQVAEVPLSLLVRAYARRGITIEWQKTPRGMRLSARPGGPAEGVAMGRGLWRQSATLYVVETPERVYHLVTGGGSFKGAELLGSWENIFGRPGYVLVPGMVTGDPHPLYGYRPLLSGKYATVPIKNILGTAIVASAVQAAQTRYSLVKVDPNAPPLEGAAEITLGADGILQPPEGYELRPLNLALGIDVIRALEMVKQWDVFGFPMALARPEEVTAESGYDRARQQDVVASLLDPPLEKFGAALKRIFELVLTAVDKVGVPVTITAAEPKGEPGVPREVVERVTVEPEDVRHLDLRVSFDSVTLFSRIAMQEEGLKVRAAGLKTDTEFLREDRGIEDPAEWYRLRLRDVIRREAHDRAVRDALAALDALREQTQREARAQAGVPEGTPLVPKTPEEALERASVPVAPGKATPAVPPPPEEELEAALQGPAPPAPEVG